MTLPGDTVSARMIRPGSSPGSDVWGDRFGRQFEREGRVQFATCSAQLILQLPGDIMGPVGVEDLFEDGTSVQLHRPFQRIRGHIIPPITRLGEGRRAQESPAVPEVHIDRGIGMEVIPPTVSDDVPPPASPSGRGFDHAPERREGDVKSVEQALFSSIRPQHCRQFMSGSRATFGEHETRQEFDGLASREVREPQWMAFHLHIKPPEAPNLEPGIRRHANTLNGRFLDIEDAGGLVHAKRFNSPECREKAPRNGSRNFSFEGDGDHAPYVVSILHGYAVASPTDTPRLHTRFRPPQSQPENPRPAGSTNGAIGVDSGTTGPRETGISSVRSGIEDEDSGVVCLGNPLEVSLKRNRAVSEREDIGAPRARTINLQGGCNRNRRQKRGSSSTAQRAQAPLPGEKEATLDRRVRQKRNADDTPVAAVLDPRPKEVPLVREIPGTEGRTGAEHDSRESVARRKALRLAEGVQIGALMRDEDHFVALRSRDEEFADIGPRAKTEMSERLVEPVEGRVPGQQKSELSDESEIRRCRMLYVKIGPHGLADHVGRLPSAALSASLQFTYTGSHCGEQP